MAIKERTIRISNGLFTVKHCVSIVPGFEAFSGRSSGKHIQDYINRNPRLPQLYTVSYAIEKNSMGYRRYKDSPGVVSAFNVSLTGCGPQLKSNKEYIVVIREAGLYLLERVSWWDMGISREAGFNLYTKTHLHHLFVDRGVLPEDLAESFTEQLAQIV